jgi:hypothetical protein
VHIACLNSPVTEVTATERAVSDVTTVQRVVPDIAAIDAEDGI